MTFTETALTTGVDPEISAAVAIYERLAPLKDALGLKDLTVPELQLFAMVAHHTGLDPFTKQIYAVKRDGKVNHQTGIDGYRAVAESKGGGQYAGSDEPTFEPCDCGQLPKDHPKVARVVIHRILPNGHVMNQVGIARWHELYTGNAQQFMWKQMPQNQLAKCAEANGLRKAFPRVLGGVYIAEEMEQAGPADNGPLLTAAAQPTARERIAARRAAIEAAEASVADDGEALFVEGESREVDPEPVEAPSVAAFSEGEVAGPACNSVLILKDKSRVPCTLGEMHAGEHSFTQLAIESGGRVVRSD